MTELVSIAAAWPAVDLAPRGRMTSLRLVSAGFAALLLAACQSGGAPSDSTDSAAQSGEVALPDADSTEAYDGIRADETIRFSGTEPFWGGTVTGTTLTYTTPDKPDGMTVAVERFAGRGGLSFSGSLAGTALEMMVTPLRCSDGMSDRIYPFTVTLKLGEDLRNGCAWTERQRFEGPERP